ncbi:hypothetical protein PybrP1_008602 [[Pythium] brassicae (nom. inval.)]|nr:hypothetical protein PybrP1_008602 [[Pythium] brassicae (nom. inval.)]
MGGLVCNAARAVVHAWESLKVELHGKYSAECMLHVRSYCANTGVTREALWITLTPLLSLFVAIGIDMLPLEPPDRGFAGNASSGKTAISALVQHAEDDKPEFVMFHIEVFHSMLLLLYSTHQTLNTEAQSVDENVVQGRSDGGSSTIHGTNAVSPAENTRAGACKMK